MKTKTYQQAYKAAVKMAKETGLDTYVTVSCMGGYFVETVDYGGSCLHIRANA